MAITTVQAGSGKLKAVLVKRGCLGPGGAVLTKGMTVRMAEADAYTLVSGEQAEFITDTPAKSPVADK
jgi:hypothetical protein